MKDIAHAKNTLCVFNGCIYSPVFFKEPGSQKSNGTICTTIIIAEYSLS